MGSLTREDLATLVAERRAKGNVEPILYAALTPDALEGLLTLPLEGGARVEVTGAEILPPGALALYEPLAILNVRVVEGPPPPPVIVQVRTRAPRPPLDREVE